MEEEIWESDDYADWIAWVADEKKKGQALSGLANPEVPTLLQIQQVDDNASWKVLEGQAVGTKESNKDSRWEDICEKLRIDPSLDELKRPMLWECWRGTETYLHGIRENLDAAQWVSIPLTLRDLCPVGRLLDDCPTGRKLRLSAKLTYW
jgi:hypothetical protein